MRIVLPFLGIAGAVVIAATSCNALPALGTGCGNHVIDDGEDCDGNYDTSTAVCITTGPSQCHFSCATSSCPAPFTCGGIDHVCRRPAGTFRTSVSVAGEASRRVLVGDFDGDQAQDVVTVGLTSRVHFFDGRTSSQEALLSSDTPLPALGHVTLDGRMSGILTSTYNLTDPSTNVTVQQGNVRVWRGSPDRTLLPTVYPNIDLTTQKVTAGHAISVLRANQLGSDVFALLTINGTTLLFYVNGTLASTSPFPLSAPLGDPTKIHGRVPVGTLGTSSCAPAPFTACQAIVLAFEGEKTVSVHSSCDDTILGVNALGTHFVPAKVLTLPNNDVVGGPAFLLPDPNNGAASVYVVGTGGAVYQFAPDSTQCSLATTGTTLTLPTKGEPPLALGYIADNVDLSWVDTKGIHVNASGYIVLTAAPTNTVWNDAVIDDMNLNGLPDVVAFAPGSIDFYNGSGGVLLNGKHITLDGIATHVAVGDFDGDFVKDIAVSTKNDSTGLTTDSIDVSFGTFTGFPIEPVSVGRLANLAQLEPTFFDYRISGSPDLINTLFALGNGETGDLVVSILQGNPDRLINSPYFLFDPGAPGSNVSIITTAVGDFTGKSPNHEGIGGVSTSTAGAGLWFTPMTGDAQVDVANTIFGKLPANVTLANVAFERTVAAAIDVGATPGKELLVVQPDAFFLTSVPQSGTDWPSLAYEPLQNVAPVPDKGLVVRVIDVDGDGDDDVIVEYLASGTFAAKIILNGMNGTLSFANAPALTLPDGALAVTAIHANKDGSTQIAALSAKGVYLAQMTNGVLGPWTTDPIIDLSSVTVKDMIAGDVDGDGVDDLVIATSKGFVVYFGDPA
jgi:hypothetical protein